MLEQVSVFMQPQTEFGLVEDFIIPLPSLTAATSPGIVYVSYTRESPEDFAVGSFQCTLKFLSKELDPSTGEPEEDGYEDEYQVEDIELSAGGDYLIPSYTAFDTEWKKLESGASATETFVLSGMESLKGAQWAATARVEMFWMLMMMHSCVRLHHRGSQYGTLGRITDALVDDRTHVTAVRAGGRWRRHSPGTESDDVCCWAGSDPGGGRACGDRGGLQLGYRRSERVEYYIMNLLSRLSYDSYLSIGSATDAVRKMKPRSSVSPGDSLCRWAMVLPRHYCRQWHIISSPLVRHHP